MWRKKERILDGDLFENLFELCRRALQSTDFRLSMDCCLIFLVGTKIGQLVANGASMQSVNITLDDLYQKPNTHAPLKTYWDTCPPLAELLTAKRTVNQLKELQIGSVLALALLQEFELFLVDLDKASLNEGAWNSDYISGRSLLEQKQVVRTYSLF